MIEIRHHGGPFGAGKYRKGSKIHVLDLKSGGPVFITKHGNGTYNQTINYQYANDATQRAFLAVYGGTQTQIRVYLYDGTYISSFNFNESSYGKVNKMVEYKDHLYVFGGLGSVKYRISDGLVITSNSITTTGNGYGFLVGNEYFLPHTNNDGRIHRVNLDTFALVNTHPTSFAQGGIRARDDQGNWYGFDSGPAKLYKYSPSWTLLNSVALSMASNSLSRSVVYSKKRNSVLVGTFSADNLYIEEYSAGDLRLIKVHNMSAQYGMGTGTCRGLYKTGNWILYLGDYNVYVFNEATLEYAGSRNEALGNNSNNNNVYVTDEATIYVRYSNGSSNDEVNLALFALEIR